MRQAFYLIAFFSLAACSTTAGDPVDKSALGFGTCEEYFDCGPGRYCSEDGFCSADCRMTGDCHLFGEGMVCNRFGQCLEPDGKRRCDMHEDCGAHRYCNGICSLSKASCGTGEPCPYGEESGDECEGTCGGHCGSDNDCLQYEKELTCTPVGLCLQAGWEQWIELGKLPPISCKNDDQCKERGWEYVCECEQTMNDRTGRMECKGGAEAVCVPEEEYDFGCGAATDDSHFADHPLCGVWGTRLAIGTVTYGLPLIPQQPTYSSNLFLIKLSRPAGGELQMQTKVCDIQLINFRDDDEPFSDLGWMMIPYPYYRSLPVLVQTANVGATTPGSPYTTSQSVEVRGCVLDNPATDPLPTMAEYKDNPGDPRFWDQDEDGNVGMTTLMDGVLRGEAYNVQRWKATYDGEILDDTHIRGPASVINEQFLIAASDPSLEYDTETVMHEDPTRTYFRMLRMDADSDCADLIRIGTRDDSFLRHTNHLMGVECVEDNHCATGFVCDPDTQKCVAG